LKQAQDQLIRTEKEKEAENIRVRISRDIHDEVGATLSGVALFSEIAKQKMEQRQDDDAQIYLQHITDNSKEMVEKMSDIVWAINPQNDSFDRIIAKLESYAFNLCAGKSIRLHLDIDDSIRSYQPGMKVRKNIYMLMKEAINNAVKYSASRNIYFTLKNNNGSILAELKDDGKGFDTRHPKEGNGLNNMKARAEELNARLDIHSASGEGTCIRLEFDFHPAGGHLEVV
jgi:signal transduction histidine kinase